MTKKGYASTGDFCEMLCATILVKKLLVAFETKYFAKFEALQSCFFCRRLKDLQS
jgi:hypothetical protein